MDKEQAIIVLRELSKRLRQHENLLEIAFQQHQDDVNLFQQLSDLITEEEEAVAE